MSLSAVKRDLPHILLTPGTHSFTLAANYRTPLVVQVTVTGDDAHIKIPLPPTSDSPGPVWSLNAKIESVWIGESGPCVLTNAFGTSDKFYGNTILIEQELLGDGKTRAVLIVLNNIYEVLLPGKVVAYSSPVYAKEMPYPAVFLDTPTGPGVYIVYGDAFVRISDEDASSWSVADNGGLSPYGIWFCANAPCPNNTPINQLCGCVRNCKRAEFSPGFYLRCCQLVRSLEEVEGKILYCVNSDKV